jgi:hypothetical protein
MEIYKKDGSLSAYGYACGYVNRVENKITDQYKELYKEHNTFHVKWNIGNGREWKSYELLADALKKFNSIKIKF